MPAYRHDSVKQFHTRSFSMQIMLNQKNWRMWSTSTICVTR